MNLYLLLTNSTDFLDVEIYNSEGKKERKAWVTRRGQGEGRELTNEATAQNYEGAWAGRSMTAQQKTEKLWIEGQQIGWRARMDRMD